MGRSDDLQHHVVLLDGAFGEEEVEDGKDGGHCVAEGFGANVLGGEESCVEGGEDP